jgi:uncharacterized membrane protein
LSRPAAGLFYTLLGISFAFGRVLPPVVIGYLVLAMALLAAAKQVGPAPASGPPREARIQRAAELKNRLFIPPLLIPATAVLGSLLLPKGHAGALRLVDPAQATLVALALGALFALVVAARFTRVRPVQAVRSGDPILGAVGWAMLLPQSLAALGGIFAKAGIGAIVATWVGRALPGQGPFTAVAAYAVGMALLTICLGNAFAAFAVVTAGIGLPLVVQAHHANPAILGALGMLAGYCGTLVTPMAANFNIVPALLLELSDERAVIKAQLPMAALIFAFNLLLMASCVFRF